MSNLKYHLVAFVVVAIWGSTFVFTKMLLQAGLSPAQIFTLRFIIAYVLLLAFTFLRDKVTFSPPELGGGRGGLNKRKQEADRTPSGSPFSGGEKESSFRWFCNSWRDELLMIALGITGGSLYFLTENAAMLFTTATNTSLIVCSCPLFAMLLFAVFFRQSEKITRLQAFGSLIAFLGMAVVVLNGHFVLHLSPLGDLLAFGACLCWAVYSLLMKACQHLLFFTFSRFHFFNHSESSLPGSRRLDALLPHLELGHRQARSCHRHKLGLLQSHHHYPLCLVAARREDHHLVSPRLRSHPPWNVPRRQEKVI